MFNSEVKEIKGVFTEDELVNFKIDMWEIEQKIKNMPPEHKAPIGESVTVIVTSDNYYK